ncbi:MAG: protein translocase subunit SecF [Patescibacteria group bacterium]
MYHIIQKRKIFLTISAILCGISILALIFWGLKTGIDFSGGTIMELNYSNQLPSNQEIKDKLKDLNLPEIIIQRSGEKSLILRFKNVDEATHQKILEKLDRPEEIRFESIGPTIGRELTRKARWAILIAVVAILIYIAWAFRKLSKIIKKGESWRYGGGAILALIHDLILILGLYAILGHFKGTELNSTFIVAILTVLGYSVNDTIIVYDRIRENFLIYGWRNFEETINRSLNETLIRSLNTTLTTVLAILIIIIFGGESIRDFMLAMALGISTGTWSSISIATPFLLFKRK